LVDTAAIKSFDKLVVVVFLAFVAFESILAIDTEISVCHLVVDRYLICQDSSFDFIMGFYTGQTVVYC
jgi:hypothetical protein